jgi:hypothetical protein
MIISSGTAKEIRKWLDRCEKEFPGIMKTLFWSAFSTNFSPSFPGASGKI